MPLTISKVLANTATVTITYAEEEVNITYLTSYLTERNLKDLQGFVALKAVNNSDTEGILQGLGDMYSFMSNLITKWDFMNDDGTMYPITLESLAPLPFDFSIAVFTAILGEITGNAPAQTTNPQS